MVFVNYLLFIIYSSLLVTTFAPDFKNELFNLNKNSRRNEIYQVTYYHRITFAQGNASWRISLM